MDNTFTTQAKRALRLASGEAPRSHGDYQGTEHLLLALLHEKASPAARSLARLNVDYFTVWREIDRRSAKAPLPLRLLCLPQSPRLKLAIDRAKQEAGERDPDAPVGVRELLLGLLNDSECVAATILVKLGVDLSAAREEVRAEPGPWEVRVGEPEDTSDQGICLGHEIDHVLSAPCSQFPERSLDLLGGERSLVHETALSRLWCFLLRLLRLKISVRS